MSTSNPLNNFQLSAKSFKPKKEELDYLIKNDEISEIKIIGQKRVEPGFSIGSVTYKLDSDKKEFTPVKSERYHEDGHYEYHTKEETARIAPEPFDKIILAISSAANKGKAFFLNEQNRLDPKSAAQLINAACEREGVNFSKLLHETAEKELAAFSR